ncbi:MAG: hypothetical protein M5U08_10525 [Burkholderiales bacterium]|nr:hypothetical protein [Burkholderiales bacterium]
MRAEDAAVGVQLVDDHVAQALEELRPLGVMRQDPGVQHVRIGDDDVAVGAHGAARIARRVAVERAGAHAEAACGVQCEDLGDLVLRERLGGEEVERLGPAAERRIEHRQVVAERLARRGRRHHDGVAAGRDVVPGGALVRVEPLDAARVQCGDEPRIERLREWGIAGRAFRDDELARDALAMPALEQGDQRLGRTGAGRRAGLDLALRVGERDRCVEQSAHDSLGWVMGGRMRMPVAHGVSPPAHRRRPR